MKGLAFLAVIMLVLAAPQVCVAATTTPRPHGTSPQDSLFKTVAGLYAEVFATYNHCSSPEELQKHATFFAPDVIYYHDDGSVTRSRSEYIDRTKTTVCGRFRQELIAGGLQVFPVKGYGAIEQERHKFCSIKTSKCFATGRLFILWHHANGKWLITRAFAYDFRFNKPHSPN